MSDRGKDSAREVWGQALYFGNEKYTHGEKQNFLVAQPLDWLGAMISAPAGTF